MTVSEKIKEDWGTLRHFAKKQGLNYFSLTNALVGKTHYKSVTKKLIELKYISCATDLAK